jgi:predicted Ser/Thr protein kinase
MKTNKIDITHKQLPFELEDKIGEGTYGVVFKVTYNAKPAVLKVFKETYGNVREDNLREVYNSLYLSGKKYFPKVYEEG